MGDFAGIKSLMRIYTEIRIDALQPKAFIPASTPLDSVDA
jgi:hypothetical protein